MFSLCFVWSLVAYKMDFIQLNRSKRQNVILTLSLVLLLNSPGLESDIETLFAFDLIFHCFSLVTDMNFHLSLCMLDFSWLSFPLSASFDLSLSCHNLLH